VIRFTPKKSDQRAVLEEQRFDVTTNLFNNNKHVKISLITESFSGLHGSTLP